MKVTTTDQLGALYDLPNERTKGKQLISLDKHADIFICKNFLLLV